MWKRRLSRDYKVMFTATSVFLDNIVLVIVVLIGRPT